MKKKILTIVGTRPEIIKLCRIIKVLDEYTDHCFVHTGQNYDYELNKIFFEDLDIREPDYYLDCAGDDIGETIGNILKKVSILLLKVKPDAVLIYGDTNSGLSSIIAKKLQIPIFHMEAGNRCFDLRVPEESNRKMIDHISDVNMVISSNAKQYLINEGIRADKIFQVGSTMPEVFNYYKDKIYSSKIVDNLGLIKNKYFLFSIHREENVENSENLEMIFESIKSLYLNFKLKIIISTHPRTKKKITNELIKKLDSKNIIFMQPFSYTDYSNLMLNSFCVISDSGTIFEEAAILNFPAVTLRNTHERPEGFDQSVLFMASLTSGNLNSLVEIARKEHEKERTKTLPDGYDSKNTTEKVLRIILSYIDHINHYAYYKK